MQSEKYKINLDSEEEVSRLLSALPRVDAPSNFDFRVKAKIASGKRSKSWIERIPVAVRFALPTLLILVVGAYFYFSRVTSNDGSPAPQIEALAPAPVTNGSPADSSSQNNSNLLAAKENPTSTPEQTWPGNSNRMVRPPASGLSGKPAGGSLVEAKDQPNTITRPGTQDKSRIPDDMAAVASSVKRGLSQIGIADTVYEGGGWKVVVVTNNSLAKRSGIVAGDIVTAIGKQQLSQNSIIHNVADQLTVRRGGKTVNINLRQPPD